MNPPRRRWFAFSLRTLFVGVTMAAIPLGWVGYSLNWIREREQFAENRAQEYWRDPTDKSPVLAPSCLWLFGEPGRGGLVVLELADVEFCKRLFPEAEVELLGN